MDFGAGFACGFGEGAGERAEASMRERCGADWVRVGHGTQEENGCRSGGPRAERGAEDAAGGDDSAKELGVEEFGNEIGGGHGTPTDEIEHARLAEAADAAAGLEKIPEIFG